MNETKERPWHKLRHDLIVVVVSVLLTLAATEWKSASEAKLLMSTLGYRVEAPLRFPILGFKVGETGGGYYWMQIRNDGNKPLHNVRVGLENMGKIYAIHSSISRWTIRNLGGERVEDMNAFSGQTSLGFTIDSLPPKGTMTLVIVCYAGSVKGIPYPTLSSEEALGQITINDPALEDIAQFNLQPDSSEFKENNRNLRKWEKGSEGQ